MMKISQHIFLAALAALAASCSSDNLPETLSGNGEKTPITIAATISDGGTPLSRAEGKTFASGDQLIARLRQVTWDGTSTDYISGVSQVAADQSPRTVTFTVGSGAMTVVNDSTQQTGDLTPNAPLYWDDFSNSASESTDIRTAGHYLQSAWGFCYNGGTPTTALSQTDGTITWTATGNFDSQSTFTKNDLLWSAAQKPISYKHAAGDRETLVIPYTHAMSKFTIVVNATDGFAAGALASTTIALQGMYSSATFSAPDGKVSAQPGTQSVTMLKATPSGNTCTFTALAIPGKALKGTILAKITDVNGNNYDIPVTNAILAQWKDQLLGVNNDVIKSGINYMLTVTVKKQGISVVAQITDWTTINATGTGEINFNADVTDSGVENGITNGSIDIFRAEDLASMNTMTTMTTTATYNSGKWVNSPEIYWANGTQSYYFRALTEYDGSNYKSVGGSNGLARGHDVLWGTTKAHSGTAADGSTFDYDEGAAIAPRTGNVPLTFSHVMSKITVNLTTDESDAKVVLDGAKITINGLNESGTIDLEDGTVVLGSTTTDISDFAAKSHPITGVTTLNGYVVMPQVLGNEIRLRVKLADGTTYSLQLNQCLDSSKQVIGEWKKGTHYEYTIKLTKEAIDFVALVKKWEDVSGGGDANLDWD